MTERLAKPFAERSKSRELLRGLVGNELIIDAHVGSQNIYEGVVVGVTAAHLLQRTEGNKLILHDLAICAPHKPFLRDSTLRCLMLLGRMENIWHQSLLSGLEDPALDYLRTFGCFCPLRMYLRYLVFIPVLALSGCSTINNLKSFATPYHEPPSPMSSRLRVITNQTVRLVPGSTCIDWKLPGVGMVNSRTFAVQMIGHLMIGCWAYPGVMGCRTARRFI